MTRTFPILAFLCLWAGSLLAQSLVKQADTQFNQLAYAKAIELYEQALAKPASLSAEELRLTKTRLGYSYQQIRDMVNAERVYRDLISSGSLSPEDNQYYLYYAQSLASNGKYREAQEAYEKYSTLQTMDKRGPAFSKLYRDLTPLTKNAASYKVEFLRMNTRKAEFSPMLYKDGLVFVSSKSSGAGIKRVFNWNSTPFLDLHYLPEVKGLRAAKASSLGGSAIKQPASRMQLIRPLGSDDFTSPTANDSRTVGFFGGKNISQGYEDQVISEADRFSQTLNTKYHEGPASFTKDGSRVIFTRNNYTNGKYGQSSDRINKLKLYSSSHTNGYWSEAEELPFNSDEFSTGHPALAKDKNGTPDQLLYFASDRPGGFGGSDIYVSRWNKDKWGEPVNLGPTINSKGNELFPFVDEKGNLYFSSDGHPGLGDLDMFYASLIEEGTSATSIRNLGEPLNSPKDDFGIVTDGNRQRGYFSSNRKNGGADDDLYRFTREGSLYPCRELTVSVFDAETREPLINTTVAVDNAAANGQKQLQTDAEGLVRFCVDVDNEFSILASRDGYLDNKIGFSTKDMADDQPSRLDIPLSRPKGSAKAAGVVSTLRGRVIAQSDKKPMSGVKVVMINECDGSSQETTTTEDGSYSFSITSGCDYSLEAMKNDMGTTGSHIAKDGTGSTELLMFRKGDVIKIDNIYYDLNKFNIRPDAAVELDKVVALMTKYPTMRIEMRSHTDSRATSTYNNTLSANRAKAAVAYLKSKGIPAKRMIAKGYGETLLLNTCKDGINCSETDHQQNRRTEIKILSMD
ncbi:carboxypeptidase regulatory-like domain-containing protein [Spirosoma sordidisoli]|uniref:Flagellar motor protein MotB n=1 Tax=Spirosoma sordidisoli TaxID=2502893 RepID=A0A4V1RWW4_9BACT|nr:carboxypeptidase regulatory-like domain-containing protein [Spirosoma sordidisoli]RYC71678.1 flagellar motor protein MotB [Spirosoma sordidisoli]